MDAKKGDWVKIYNVILEPADRAPQVPEDTSKVPLELWVKGFIQTDASIGDTVKVKTLTDREVEGELVEVNPTYKHSFGNNIPELLKIGPQLKQLLFKGGESNER